MKFNKWNKYEYDENKIKYLRLIMNFLESLRLNSSNPIFDFMNFMKVLYYWVINAFD